jgi:1-acyl-sn-glycerol-3-phosphate acyltransferase
MKIVKNTGRSRKKRKRDSRVIDPSGMLTPKERMFLYTGNVKTAEVA